MLNVGSDFGDNTSGGGSNRLFFASPTKLSEQKPFRGFDITSLIRKDDDTKPFHRAGNGLDSSHSSGLSGIIKSAAGDSPSHRQSARSSPPSTGAPNSPPCNISLGPPHHHSLPPSPLLPSGNNPYTGLLNTGLYQQYLSQLLAANSAAAVAGGGPLNPMLLQAQLAALAAQNSHHLMAAAAAGCYNSAISERLKAQAHRFSPYPLMGSPPPLASPPAVAAPLGSPSGSSAFKSLHGSRPHSAAAAALNQASHSPPVSPPHSRATTPGGGVAAAASSMSSSSPPPPLISTAGPMPQLLPIKSEPFGGVVPSSPPLRPTSEIKNIEKMINGLNGTSEGRFGLSH